MDTDELVAGLRRGVVSPRNAAEVLRGLLEGGEEGFVEAVEALMRGVDRGLVEDVARILCREQGVVERIMGMVDPDRVIEMHRGGGDAGSRVSLIEFLALARPVEAMASAAALLEKLLPLLRREPSVWRKLYSMVVNGPLSMAPPRALEPVIDMVMDRLRGCCWEERAELVSMIINTYPAEILCRETRVVEKMARLLKELAEEALESGEGYRGTYVASLYRMLRGMCRRAGTEIPGALEEAEPLIARIGRESLETNT